MQFNLRYDLRNPPQWRRPYEEHYRHFLDQVAWADAHGFARVTLSEHHFAEDGYIPSLFTVAAAVAARTRRIRIGLSLVLLPLKHPVQVAEDAAMVDIISGGRMQLIVGAGYRLPEFEGYGIPMRQRPGRMTEGIEIIRRCWEEEEFSFEGKYWSLKNVRVVPKPVQKPRPLIGMGGSSPAAARRAARLADYFAGTSPRLMSLWRDEMAALGKEPPSDAPMPNFDEPRQPSSFLHIARDPWAAWKVIGPHALYESNTYASWAGDTKYGPYQAATDPGQLLAPAGGYGVMTPEDAVSLGERMEQARPGRGELIFHPMMGGMPLELGQESLELVAGEVMPHFSG